MRSLADTTELPVRVATLSSSTTGRARWRRCSRPRSCRRAGKQGERLFKLVSEARRATAARRSGTSSRDRRGRPGVPVISPASGTCRRASGSCACSSRTRSPAASAPSCTPSRSPTRRPSGSPLRSSPPSSRTRTAGASPKVALGRTFRTGTTLYCQYNVYGAEAAGKHDWAPHALGGWALRRGDELVREVPPTLIQPGGDGRLTRTLGISLQGAPRASTRSP